MIVQSAPQGQPHFVILQTDHALTSGQLAKAFGNKAFAPLTPRALMEFVSAHHDEGWAELDQRFLQDPRTGLPYNLVQTPLAELVRTGAGSPDFNQAHHPFCGLISSMHTYGLYHGRYGLSDKIFIDLMPDQLRPFVSEMLTNELVRQEQIKTTLRNDRHTAAWVTEEAMFHNYKLLQFFDTLALYFHTTHSTTRTTAEFMNVPRTLGDDVTITIRPLGDDVYGLSPYPFQQDQLTITTKGRYLTPQPEGTDLAAVIQALPFERQTATLTAD